MKSMSRGFSLRAKLLLILTTVPVVALTFYLFMATQLFERDKIAYVYDSSVSLSSAMSTQFRLEVESVTEKVKFYVENFDPTAQKFSVGSKLSFDNQSRILAIAVHRLVDQKSQIVGTMTKGAEGKELYNRSIQTIREVRRVLGTQELVVRILPETGKHLILGYKLRYGSDKEAIEVTVVVEAERLIETVVESRLFNHMIVTMSGQTIVGSTTLENFMIDQAHFQEIIAPIKSARSQRGTKEVRISRDKVFLVSYSDLGVGDLALISVVRKDLALEAVNLLIAKSVVFFVAIVCLTVIISLFASVKLTSTLTELVEATRLMAKGQFNKKVIKRSDDEVGSLAESFNVMASEVSRLLDATADKARLENELATVQTVQETLFPEDNVNFGPVTISGHYEPATGCGGDWWSYSLIGDRVWVWIGDATGHGASAALITSAARAVSSVLEIMPDIVPSKAMQILNQAIYDTSKGKMMMTFFIGALDLTTGELSYANASHDPPFLIKTPASGDVKRRDLIPLNDVNGLRLGEQRRAAFDEAKIQIGDAETVVFYTDGISEVKNSKGISLGERGFLKVIASSSRTGLEVSERVALMKASIADYREGNELPDDITFFMMNYRKAS